MRGKDDAQDDVRKNLRVIVKICNVSTFKINDKGEICLGKSL